MVWSVMIYCDLVSSVNRWYSQWYDVVRCCTFWYDLVRSGTIWYDCITNHLVGDPGSDIQSQINSWGSWRGRCDLGVMVQIKGLYFIKGYAFKYRFAQPKSPLGLPWAA